MKIQKLNATDYQIYVYSWKEIYDTLYEEVKMILKQLQKVLSLKGFYKVVVCQKKIGIFLEIVRLEDSFYKSTLDLKIEVVDDMNVYFQTKDYFLLKEFSSVFFYDGMYYGLVEDSLDEILEKVEFGDFVFGYDWMKILDKSYVIQ